MQYETSKTNHLSTLNVDNQGCVFILRSDYHSTTHEVLGFIRGKTTIQLGGKDGIKVKVSEGDVLIIPAGVAHRNLKRKKDVVCIGAYPNGRDYDINRGDPDERPAADQRIALVPVPATDPVKGPEKGLVRWWKP